jgi:predicted solute-binding protein
MNQQRDLYNWLDDVTTKARLYDEMVSALNDILIEKYDGKILIGDAAMMSTSYNYMTVINDEKENHRHIYDALKHIFDNLTEVDNP